MMNLIAIGLVCLCIFLGKKVGDKDRVIEEYQKSLQDCENQTVGDKILDKIKERHND